MSEFVVLLVAAALAFGVSKALRLSAIPFLLLSGIGLRAVAVAADFDVPERTLADIATVGLAMLVFSAGTELSPRRMVGRSRQITILAAIQFCVLGIAGIVVTLALGYPLNTSLYIGCALSASSTLVVVNTLQRRRQMFEPFGRLVLGVLLLQDAFIVVLLVAITEFQEGLPAVLMAVAAMSLLGLMAYVFHRYLVPIICSRMALDEEQLMLGALALLFLFSGIAHSMQISFVVGAFLAGVALSAFPINGLLRGMLNSLSSFFLALFFISLGVLFVVPPLEIFVHALILTVLLVAVTVPLVTLVAERLGYTTRASLEAGIILSQTSEFSLLIALMGFKGGQFGSEIFSMIVIITVSTMTLTPFFSRPGSTWRLMRLHPRYRKGEPKTNDASGHAVLLGYGRWGGTILRTLQSKGIQCIVVDDDAGVIHRLIAAGVTCIQGDGSDPRTLTEANARGARVVICSVRRASDAMSVLKWLKGSGAKVYVRTFERWEADSVRAEGGIPVEGADASVVAFMSWYEANRPEPAERPA